MAFISDRHFFQSMLDDFDKIYHSNDRETPKVLINYVQEWYDTSKEMRYEAQAVRIYRQSQSSFGSMTPSNYTDTSLVSPLAPSPLRPVTPPVRAVTPPPAPMPAPRREELREREMKEREVKERADSTPSQRPAISTDRLADLMGYALAAPSLSGPAPSSMSTRRETITLPEGFIDISTSGAKPSQARITSNPAFQPQRPTRDLIDSIMDSILHPSTASSSQSIDLKALSDFQDDSSEPSSPIATYTPSAPSSTSSAPSITITGSVTSETISLGAFDHTRQRPGGVNFGSSYDLPPAYGISLTPSEEETEEARINAEIEKIEAAYKNPGVAPAKHAGAAAASWTGFIPRLPQSEAEMTHRSDPNRSGLGLDDDAPSSDKPKKPGITSLGQEDDGLEYFDLSSQTFSSQGRVASTTHSELPLLIEDYVQVGEDDDDKEMREAIALSLQHQDEKKA